MANREITLVDVWGDFREFRGEMRAATSATQHQMAGLEKQLQDGLAEVREAASNHTDTAAKVNHLEDAQVEGRLAMLETNWRVALWILAAIGLATMGLIGQALRTVFLGS